MHQNQVNNHFASHKQLWSTLFLSAALPVIVGFVLAYALPGFRWQNLPFHAALEALGSFAAIIIAVLMGSMIQSRQLSSRYIWAAAALVAMGILDGFHAVLPASNNFVWLHSIATLAGGLLFALVWLPRSQKHEIASRPILATTATGAAITGLVSIFVPDILPAMVIDGRFSLAAEFINLGGGLGFAGGAAFFIKDYLRRSPSSRTSVEDVVFANHCALFGIAGLLFEFSILWDSGWWWWHVIRLAAYLVVLVYFLRLYRLMVYAIQDTNENLEQHVRERTLALEQAKEMAEASNRAKSIFLSRMSHELRTPLNAVLGFGNLMQMNEHAGQQNRIYVNEIVNAGNHLLELINEVLDLARVESGKINVNLQAVAIDEIVADTCIKILPLTQRLKIRISNECKPANRPLIQADPLRLTQVLLNLLSNAIKYNRKRGWIAIRSDIVENGRCRITVEDSGRGIPHEQQARVFEPFERLGMEAEAIDGTGIGLALTRRLVEAMGGSIGFTSTADVGTLFWVELPVAQ